MITKEPGLICIPSSIISMLIRNSGLWIMWIPDLFDGKIRWNPLVWWGKKHYFLIFWKKKHTKPIHSSLGTSFSLGGRFPGQGCQVFSMNHPLACLAAWGCCPPIHGAFFHMLFPDSWGGVQDVQVWHSMTIPSHFSGISVNLECNWRMAFFQIHMAAIGFHGSWFICLQCGSGGLRAISWWSQFVGSNAAWKLLKLRTERASLQCKVGVCRWILMSSVRCRVM